MRSMTSIAEQAEQRRADRARLKELLTALDASSHGMVPCVANQCLRARPKITFTIDKQIYIFGDIV
jgi:hypothetical protein